MMKQRVVVETLICFLLTSIAPAAAAHLQTARLEDEARKIGVGDLLAKIAIEYGCYFTVEQLGGTADAPNTISSVRVERKFPGKGLDVELESLRHDVPGFTYTVSHANDRVIHIIDGRLAQRSGYGLDAVLTHFEYSGKLSSLPSKIGEKGLPVSSSDSMDFVDSLGQDFTSAVSVKAEKTTVRDALSDFIDLRGRGPILWISTTSSQTGVSIVKFFGPAKQAAP